MEEICLTNARQDELFSGAVPETIEEMEWCASYYLPTPGDWLDTECGWVIPVHTCILRDNLGFLRAAFKDAKNFAGIGVVRAGYMEKARQLFERFSSVVNLDLHVCCWVDPLDVYLNTDLIVAVEFAFYDYAGYTYELSKNAEGTQKIMNSPVRRSQQRDPVAEIFSTARWDLVAALFHANHIEPMSRAPLVATRGQNIFTNAGQFIPVNIPRIQPEMCTVNPWAVSQYLANCLFRERCQYFLELSHFFEDLSATPTQWAAAIFDVPGARELILKLQFVPEELAEKILDLCEIPYSERKIDDPIETISRELSRTSM